MVQLSGLRYDQLIYIDESAANERSLDRKYGWSPKGQPARLISSAKRSKKWSILPVYTYDGFIDWEIIRGSYNSNMFINFIKEKVIPHTTPFPGPRSVLIMDNAKIHHHPVYLQSLFSAYSSQDVHTVCENAEIKLIYLPPYSPDLNPIEEAFAQLKAWFKKNYKLANDMAFDEFLGMGINLVKDGAKNHFIRSSAGVPLRDGNDLDYFYD